jgi:hypothetical protein
MLRRSAGTARPGLREYGLERRSLKVEDRFYGDLLMALRLNAAGQGVDQTR